MMKNKGLYNYKRALTIPFMVQKLTKKFTLHKAIPITWFVTMGLSILAMFTILRPVFAIFDVITGLKLAVQIVFPFIVTHLYHTLEPDGLKIHEYVIDLFIYLYSIRLGNKKIYQGELVEVNDTEKIEF